jgi:hypothetical protein
LWSPLKGTGCNYCLLSGCEKENYLMLKEEIGSNFAIDELLHLPMFHSLNIIHGRSDSLTTFITELPPQLS